MLIMLPATRIKEPGSPADADDAPSIPHQCAKQPSCSSCSPKTAINEAGGLADAHDARRNPLMGQAAQLMLIMPMAQAAQLMFMMLPANPHSMGQAAWLMRMMLKFLAATPINGPGTPADADDAPRNPEQWARQPS